MARARRPSAVLAGCRRQRYSALFATPSSLATWSTDLPLFLSNCSASSLNSSVYLGFLPMGPPPSHRSGTQVSTKSGQAHSSTRRHDILLSISIFKWDGHRGSAELVGQGRLTPRDVIRDSKRSRQEFCEDGDEDEDEDED